jgi:hypothetical protein
MRKMTKKGNPPRPIIWILVIGLALSACNLPAIALDPTPTPHVGEPPVMLTLYVTLSGDDSNDCLSEETACQTLWEAIRKSRPYSTINIGPGEFSNTSGVAWTISHALTIRGAGRDQTSLVSERTSVNVMVSRGVEVTISDLTLGRTPGVEDSHGAGLDVRNRDAVVTLENCRVRETFRGIMLISGRLTVRNCIIEENVNGISIQTDGNLTLGDSVVRNNSHTSGSPLFNSGTALIENTHFENNGTSSGGAASSAISTGGQLEMNGGRIANNNGDGIFISGGEVILTGVAVDNNSRTGIWHVEGVTEIWSSTIRNNAAYGISVGGRSGISDFGIMRIRNSALIGNGASGLRLDGGQVQVQNSTISGNRGSSSGGGGVWQYGGSLFLLDSTVAFNIGHGLQGNVSGAGGPTVTTVRRSVIALNTGDECSIDPRVSISLGTPGLYVCSEDWTQATLGLGSLTEEAGTYVHPILAGSPLIDAGGPATVCPPNDQRGYPRPIGTTCDVGAYEFGATLMAIVAGTAEPQTPDAITTLAPTETPQLIVIWTDTPSVPLFTFDQNANCRRGPGTAYGVATSYSQGTQLQADGRNEDSTWLRLLMPNSTATCWVSLAIGTLLVSPDTLPLVSYPPPPTATTSAPQLGAPPQFQISERMCSPNGYKLRLTWASQSDGKTGYRLYRNGSLLATLGANATTYEDLPPFGGPYTYAIESYNANSTSPRSQVTDPVCSP